MASLLIFRNIRLKALDIYVRQVLNVVTGMLLMRAGPQDLPTSTDLLRIAAIANFVALSMQLTLTLPPIQALVAAGMAVLLTAGFVMLVLRQWRKPERFVQTATAMMAVNAVITLISIGPMVAMAPYLEAISANPDQANLVQPPGGAALLWVALGVWKLLAMGHVLRNALEIRLLFAVLLFIVFGLFVSVAVSLVVGSSGGL